MGGAASSGPRIKLIEPNLYHVRAEFRVISGLVNIGTHMALIKLPSGKFLVLDTVPLDNDLKQEIDELTNFGQDIEAVVATHPFHTLAFPKFFETYPNTSYYGTPRHLRNQKNINWVGDITEHLGDWENSGVFMRIPAGAEWVAPKPEDSNHFNSVWVFAQEAKTVFIDDSIMYFSDPSFILKAIGARADSMMFHPSLKGPALVPAADSPAKYKAWVEKLLEDWDFDNICAAHLDNKIGGAKEALRSTLEKAQPLFDTLTERFGAAGNAGEQKEDEEAKKEMEQCKKANVEGSECG
eukprot:TRINITY_DN1968_c0_g1_i1.p1 TRINITY_DN1968_c0_g1~~TRINITY_DN1968_c0_g1_i1.p1  ORF type:complete len:296 (+),score=110.22 TRINITY_DN1968_c0_g1_i1:125-1012(+)